MAKDRIHNAVKAALENEGWAIIADPLTIDLNEDDTFSTLILRLKKQPVPLIYKELSLLK